MPVAVWRRFLTNTSAASAIEFAMVASALIFTILFVMVLGLVLYLNQALDYATAKAARQIMIGAPQTSAMTLDQFRTQDVCPNLPAAFNCNNVIVNVQTVTEAAKPGGYYTFVKSDLSGLIMPTLSNTSSQFSLGAQGSYEYVQIVYPITFLPSFMASFLGAQATFNGSPAYLAVSTAAFRNEQY